MRFLGLLVIAALVAFALLAGAAATVLVVAWALLVGAAGFLLARPHAHLDATGVPSPGRTAAAQALYITSAVLVVVFASGWVDGLVWRVRSPPRR